MNQSFIDKVQIACGDDNAFMAFKKHRITKMVSKSKG